MYQMDNGNLRNCVGISIIGHLNSIKKFLKLYHVIFVTKCEHVILLISLFYFGQ